MDQTELQKLNRRLITAAVVDNVLRILISSSALAAGLVAPNIFLALDKPLSRYYDHLDERSRDRELRRILAYMKSRQLIKGDYQFGLKITERGLDRLSRHSIDSLRIDASSKWDGKWRIIFYDIPEKNKGARDALTARLRRLKFYQLQRSVWITPFPCRQAIETITVYYKVSTYVTLVETGRIDNQEKLIDIFQKRCPNTTF